MATTTQRDQKFLKYWEKKRLYKRRFILTFAGIWALIGLPAYLFRVSFNLSEIDYAQLIFNIFFHFAIGFLFAHWSFKENEKRYVNLTTPAEEKAYE